MKLDREDEDLRNNIVNESGYTMVWLKDSRKATTVHRLVAERKYGRSLLSNELVDHIDGNKSNNSRSNLRLVGYFGNAANRRKTLNSKSSKYKGVSFDRERNKWRACIENNGKTFQIGRFGSEMDAAIAYNAKATELFGEFAFLNEVL